MEFRDRLEHALGPEANELPDEVVNRLQSLDQLVSRWGQAIRLVGFKTPDERAHRYFGEALATLAWLPYEGHALDVGSGGGSPALPLAIARPSMRWTLVEANERKAMFLDEAARALSLENVTVVRSRYEDVEPSAAFDVVTLRGVSVAQKTLDKLGSELRPGGRLLWMSSEALLAAGREALAQNDAWARCTGPIPLLSGGGFLLVVDVRA